MRFDNDNVVNKRMPPLLLNRATEKTTRAPTSKTTSVPNTYIRQNTFLPSCLKFK